MTTTTPPVPWGAHERDGALSLYVHVPFCSRKCAFCDLSTGRPRTPQEPFEYLTMLRREMVRASEEEDGLGARPVESVYFGGGTPTSLPPEGLAGVLWLAQEVFSVPADAECSLEADPGTVDKDVLDQLHRAGFDRISFGLQVVDDRLLRLLGRIHTVEQARDAVRWAREVGFSEVSVDLILGLPGVSAQIWTAGIEQVVSWPLTHVSMYALHVEPDTAFGRRQAAGKLSLPPDDAVVDMGDWAEERLAQAGFERYELSSYALPGHRCHHNLGYWRGREYRGFGAGAHSYVSGQRFWNVRLPGPYIRKVAAGQPPRGGDERLDWAAAQAEAAILALRTSDGIARSPFARRFGEDPWRAFELQLAPFVAGGLVCVDETSIRLTARGRWLYNPVAEALLPESPGADESENSGSSRVQDA